MLIVCIFFAGFNRECSSDQDKPRAEHVTQHMLSQAYKHDDNDSWGISGFDDGSVVTFAITVTCFLLLKLVSGSLFIYSSFHMPLFSYTQVNICQ